MHRNPRSNSGMKLFQADQRNKSHCVFCLLLGRKDSPFSFVCKHLLVYEKMEEALAHINLESGLMNLYRAMAGQMVITYKLPDEQENLLVEVVS